MTTHSEEDISRIENKGKENGKKERRSAVLSDADTGNGNSGFVYLAENTKKGSPFTGIPCEQIFKYKITASPHVFTLR